MAATAEAAYVTAPISGEVMCLSVTDTAARFAIPAAFVGMPCTFVMEGAKADILFGSSAVVCTYGDPSGVSSEAVTVDANSGLHLNDGQPVYLVMPSADRATHFSVDCVGSGSGKLTIAITGAR